MSNMEKADKDTMKNHAGSYVCPTCKSVFGNVDVFVKHCKFDHIHACKICYEVFVSETLVDKHVQLKHRLRVVGDTLTEEPENVKQKSYVCVTCKSTFFDKDVFMEHCKKDHVFECKVCSKVFQAKYKLEKHIDLKHKKFQCKMCGATFQTEVFYEHHMGTHAPPKKCNLCKKVFHTKAKLEAHRKSHKGQKFRCPECSRSFNNEFLLADHISSHSDPCALMCTACETTFKTMSCLDSHVKTCELLNQGTFTCPICCEIFSKLETFERHFKTHKYKQPSKKIVSEVEPLIVKEPKLATATVTRSSLVMENSDHRVTQPKSLDQREASPFQHKIQSIQEKVDGNISHLKLAKEGYLEVVVDPQSQKIDAMTDSDDSSVELFNDGETTGRLLQQDTVTEVKSIANQVTCIETTHESYPSASKEVHKTNEPGENRHTSTITSEPRALTQSPAKVAVITPEMVRLHLRNKISSKSTKSSLEKNEDHSSMSGPAVETSNQTKSESVDSPTDGVDQYSKALQAVGQTFVEHENNARQVAQTTTSTDTDELGGTVESKTEKLISGPVFACSECDEEFLTLNELTVHEETHWAPLPPSLSTIKSFSESAGDREVRDETKVEKGNSASDSDHVAVRRVPGAPGSEPLDAPEHHNMQPLICNYCGQELVGIEHVKSHLASHRSDMARNKDYNIEVANKQRAIIEQKFSDRPMVFPRIGELSIKKQQALEKEKQEKERQEKYKANRRANRLERKRKKEAERAAKLKTSVPPNQFICIYCKSVFKGVVHMQRHLENCRTAKVMIKKLEKAPTKQCDGEPSEKRKRVSKGECTEKEWAKEKQTEELRAGEQRAKEHWAKEHWTKEKCTEIQRAEKQPSEKQRAEKQPSEKQRAEKQPSEKPPSEKQRAEKQHAEKQRSQEQCIEEQGTDGKGIEEQFAEVQCAEEECTEVQFAEIECTEEEWAAEKHAEEKHAEEKHAEEKHVEEQHPEVQCAEEQVIDEQSVEVECAEKPCPEEQLSEEQLSEEQCAPRDLQMGSEAVMVEQNCGICQMSFSSKRELSSHIQEAHEQGIGCEECYMTFNNEESLYVHQLQNHDSEKGVDELNCSICQMSFSDKEELSNHTAQAHGQEIQCEECDLTFTSEASLYQHQLKTHESEKVLYELKCNICQLSFASKEELSDHIEEAHEQEMKKCPTCGLLFKTETLLYVHRLKNHAKASVYRCDVCHQAFATRVKLEVHRSAHRGEKLPSCTVCSLVFTKQHFLDDHMKVHPHYYQFPCEYCNVFFQTNQLRDLHTKKCYETLQKHNCHICRKTFIDVVKFKSHIATHERGGTERMEEAEDPAGGEKTEEQQAARATPAKEHDTNKKMKILKITRKLGVVSDEIVVNTKNLEGVSGEKIVKSCEVSKKSEGSGLTCAICQVVLPDAESLSSHIESKHNQVLKKCPKCALIFKSAESLHSHLAIHFKAKTHSCIACDKSFASKVKLEMHRGTHTGEKCLRCKICGFLFLEPRFLRDHMRISHPDFEEFPCEHCNKTFRTKQNRVMHVKRCHEDGPDYMCQICDKSFTDAETRRKHIETHIIPLVKKQKLDTGAELKNPGQGDKTQTVGPKKNLTGVKGVKSKTVTSKHACTAKEHKTDESDTD